MRYGRGQEEESNRVIRQFETNLQSFVRLNFVTETNDKGFYFGDGSQSLLGYIHRVMEHGIHLGNRQF